MIGAIWAIGVVLPSGCRPPSNAPKLYENHALYALMSKSTQRSFQLLPSLVMVAVFFTFALSGPLPPKEMGVILGVAVLFDAALVRLVLVPVMLRLLGK